MDIAAAIEHVRPGCRFNISTTYESLEWLADGEPPTLAECEAAWAEIGRDYLLRPVRAERDRLLAASDWTQAADAPVDAEAWAAYRQELRDLPATIKDPTAEVEWPEPPA